jgi:glutathione S-transferase
LQVLTGSFVVRLKSLSTAEVYPKSLWTQIEAKAPNFLKWATAVAAHPSVTSIFEEKKIVEGTKAKIQEYGGLV